MSQAEAVYNSILGGEKVTSRGAYLGRRRLGEDKMRDLSSRYNIEFGQVYTRGKRKKGGGGFYMLYAGTISRLFIPLNPNEYLVNHTHPKGTQKPSSFDIQYLVNSEKAGSLQRSSEIFPIGHAAFRFNKNSDFISNFVEHG